MIFITNNSVYGLSEAVRGMRNPMNSWKNSDSGFGCKLGNSNNDNFSLCKNCKEHLICNSGHFFIGPKDFELMMKLSKCGPVHAKYRRFIVVYTDIEAPLYWWKEFDTYKVGTSANSCSTMHKIHEKPFDFSNFSCEHLIGKIYQNDSNTAIEVNSPMDCLKNTITILNEYREKYLETNDKKYWWQMIQLLPSSYNQKRTVTLNYEILTNIYNNRRNHKLDEWKLFCRWIEELPYSGIITLKEDDVNERRGY